MKEQVSDDRFEVLRTLGTGASGLVQEARDRRRGGKVAVKRLHRDGAMDVVRLREEFRSLSDVLHPHLVRLHELLVVQDQTIVTMDLVEGRSFLEFVWDMDLPKSGISSGVSWPTLDLDEHDDQEEDVPEPPRPEVDEALLLRLRTALPGLVDGLSALHRAGLLHRDVKPSNVLVEPDGHVVLVDFGLAMRSGTSPTAVAGTVPYMAPEQLADFELEPASDWYAAGAMLFECLTGRAPFVGSTAQMAFDKQTRPAPGVRDLAPETPEDLARVVDGLLRTRASDRLTEVELREQLSLPVLDHHGVTPFIGRQQARETLTGVLAGQGFRLVRVCGASGMGKTRLVEQAIADLREGHGGDDEGAPLVLAGRCYEREQAPFKAVDPLVNALVDALLQEPLATTLPVDLGAAARLFPALTRLSGSVPRSTDLDVVTLRQRAVAALRDLLLQVATQRPTVLWIDDLQWADLASLRILAGVFHGASVPCALILGHRDDDPRMVELLEPLEDHEAVVVPVEPLPDEDAQAVAATLVDHPWLVQRVVHEAKGSPFFLQEIGRWLAGNDPTESSDAEGEHVRLLDGLVAARVRRLEPEERSLLEVVAVAARPLDPSVALEAARAQSPDIHAGSVATLTVQRLLTTRRGSAIECTHDRIREGLTVLLDAGHLAAVHRSLAMAIGPDGNPEVLSEHWEQAGEVARAAGFARVAAGQAEGALDFERAAALYARALRLGLDDAEEAQQVRVSLGYARARAGQGEAADALLEAASHAEGDARTELERAAVNQMLRAGHFERAYELLPVVLRKLGMRWPSSRVAATAEFVANVARIQVPFLHPRSVSEEALDMAMELAMSIAYADMLRSAVFSTRSILMASASRRPQAQAIAYAMRCSNASLLGDHPEALRCIGEARRRLPSDAEAADHASVDLHEAIHLTGLARFEEAMVQFQEVIQRLEAAGGHPYEMDMARTFMIFAVLSTGRIAEYRDLRARAIEGCRARGAKHFQVFHQVAYALPPALLDDQPDAEASNLAEAESSWGEGTSTVWLYTEAAYARLDLFRGRRREAMERLEKAYGPSRRNGLLNIDFNLNVVEILRAAATAPLAAEGDRRARKILDASVASLAGMRAPIAGASEQGWRAVQCALDGDDTGALQWNERARASARELGIPWQEAMLEAQQAWLLGEDPAPAFARLTEMGFRNPVAMTRVYCWAPGAP